VTSERRGSNYCYYSYGRRGGTVRGRESDRAPCPIGNAAVSGYSHRMFSITEVTLRGNITRGREVEKCLL
jgi:hypothetical protein